MNRGELVAALSARLGLPASGDGLLGSTSSPAALRECIASALADICMANDWPWLLASTTVVFDDGIAEIPEGVVKVRELIVDGRRARFVSLGEFIEVDSQSGGSVWTTAGATLRLSPAASLTAVLWYITAEPVLETDAASPLLPSVHHHVLLARASYHANVRRSRFDDAARDDREYERGLAFMRDSAWHRTGTRAVREQPRENWAEWSGGVGASSFTTGVSGLPTLVSYTVYDDMNQPLAPDRWVAVSELRNARRVGPDAWSIGNVFDRIGPSGTGYSLVGAARQAAEPWRFLTHSIDTMHVVWSRGAGVNSTGFNSSTITGTGTTIAAAQNSPRCVRISSTTSLGVLADNVTVCRGAVTDWANAGFLFEAVFGLPDSSYNESGASTGTRIGIGVSSGGTIATVLAGDTVANSWIGFLRRHTNGGAQDATWQLAVRDGTTQQTTNTGVTFAAAKWWRCRLWLAPGGTTVYWEITDLPANQVASGAWTPSAGLPAAGTMLLSFAGLTTVNAVTRNMDFLRMALLSRK